MEKNKIISKHLHLSEDVCELLYKKKIKERRSESSIVDDILRNELSHKIAEAEIKQLIKKAGEIH